MSANPARLTVVPSAPLPKKKTWFVRDKSGAIVFAGETYEDHVEAWGDCQLEVDSGFWGQARIAASLEAKHGDGAVKEFAKEVDKGKTWIYDMVKAYRTFGQDSSQLEMCSFTHHVEAAKASTREKAKEALEKAHDNHWTVKGLKRYVETGLEPGEKSEIDAAALALGIDGDAPVENVDAVADRAMMNFLLKVLTTIASLVVECPRTKFASDVLGGWKNEVHDHLEQLTLGFLKQRVIKAWKDGYREEAQIASVTSILTSEIHAVMRAYERDGIFEKIARTKTAMAKGTPPWIWHLVGEPIGTEAHGREFKRITKKNEDDD